MFCSLSKWWTYLSQPQEFLLVSKSSIAFTVNVLHALPGQETVRCEHSKRIKLGLNRDTLVLTFKLRAESFSSLNDATVKLFSLRKHFFFFTGMGNHEKHIPYKRCNSCLFFFYPLTYVLFHPSSVAALHSSPAHHNPAIEGHPV